MTVTLAIAPSTVPAPHPVVAQYGPIVDALRPCCPDEERRLRCGVLYLRDRATAAARQATWEASAVLEGIIRLATVHAFATMPIDELRVLRASLVRLMTAATALQANGPRSMPDGG